MVPLHVGMREPSATAAPSAFGGLCPVVRALRFVFFFVLHSVAQLQLLRPLNSVVT